MAGRLVKFGGLMMAAAAAVLADVGAADNSATWAKLQSPTRPVLPGKIAVNVQAAGDEKPSSWQLGYDGNKLSEGKFELSGDAFVAHVELPADIKVRSVFEFLIVSAAGGKISEKIVAYPAIALDMAADKIKAAKFGVIDPSGKIDKSLTAENVSFETLKTDLAKDSFVGGVAIIGGVGDTSQLADLCKRMEGRVSEGMNMIILNPPADWQGFGVRRCQLPTPRILAVGHYADANKLYEPADLGTGPWGSYLACDVADAEELIWLDSPQGQQKRVLLAVGAKFGKGTVVVADIAALDEVYDDAVGRRILCGLILNLMGKGAKS